MNVGRAATADAMRAERISLAIREGVEGIDDLVERDQVAKEQIAPKEMDRMLGVIHNKDPEHAAKMIEKLVEIRRFLTVFPEAVTVDDVRRLYALAFEPLPEYRGMSLQRKWDIQRISRGIIGKMFAIDETMSECIHPTLIELGVFETAKANCFESYWIKATAWYVYRNKAHADEILATPVLDGIAEQLRLMNDGTPGPINMEPSLRAVAFLARELCRGEPQDEAAVAKLLAVLTELLRVYNKSDVTTQVRIVQAFHASLFLGETGLRFIAETGVITLLRDDTEALHHRLTLAILRFVREICVRVPIEYRRMLIEQGIWNIVWRVFVEMDGRDGLRYSNERETAVAAQAVLFLVEAEPELLVQGNNFELLCSFMWNMPYRTQEFLLQAFLLVIARAPVTVVKDYCQCEIVADTISRAFGDSDGQCDSFMMAAMKQIVHLCVLDESFIVRLFGGVESSVFLDQLMQFSEEDPALGVTIEAIREEIQKHL